MKIDWFPHFTDEKIEASERLSTLTNLTQMLNGTIGARTQLCVTQGPYIIVSC